MFLLGEMRFKRNVVGAWLVEGYLRNAHTPISVKFPPHKKPQLLYVERRSGHPVRADKFTMPAHWGEFTVEPGFGVMREIDNCGTWSPGRDYGA